MPKLKTHKGMKKRFKVSANGKVQHKRCGSSHLMSHKNGKQVRRLRKQTQLGVAAESRRVRTALRNRPNVNPLDVEAAKMRLWQRRPRPRQALRAPVKRCQVRTERREETRPPTNELTAETRPVASFSGLPLSIDQEFPRNRVPRGHPHA